MEVWGYFCALLQKANFHFQEGTLSGRDYWVGSKNRSCIDARPPFHDFHALPWKVHFLLPIRQSRRYTNLMGSKTCKSCQLDKALGDFYLDAGYPDGHKATCKTCHNKRDYEAKRRRKLQRALKNPPEQFIRRQANLLALELIVWNLQQSPGQAIYCSTQIEGAAFPLTKGLEVTMGQLGPVVVFQTPTQRIRKSLSIEPLAHIAADMDNHKVQILFDGLAMPPKAHRLTKALRMMGWGKT